MKDVTYWFPGEGWYASVNGKELGPWPTEKMAQAEMAKTEKSKDETDDVILCDD